MNLGKFFSLNYIKDLDLREPEFVYNDDIQFVRAMHKCIDYINFTTPKDKRVPWEMIIGQAASGEFQLGDHHSSGRYICQRRYYCKSFDQKESATPQREPVEDQ